MRWPRESAITRRNEQLATTRRLSVRIAGGATAASLALAAALGFALPGHAAASAGRPAGQSGAGPGPSGPGPGTRSAQGRNHGGLAPPQQTPVSSGGPPVVSSGGS